jgi:hypothetical protein
MPISVDFYFISFDDLASSLIQQGGVMSVFTVTCDGRPAAVVSASDRINAIAAALDLAEARNLLGVVAAPRRFDARPPTDAEMAEWRGQNTEHVILHAPIAA